MWRPLFFWSAFREETRERTGSRVQADNGAALQAFVNDTAYEDGELVIAAPGFACEKSPRLDVGAMVRSEGLSYAFRDPGPPGPAKMSGSGEPGDVVRVPVPQERRSRQ